MKRIFIIILTVLALISVFVFYKIHKVYAEGYVKIQSDAADNKLIAEKLFYKHLSRSRSLFVPLRYRLRDFKIHEIKIFEEKENGFVFTASYSVRPYKRSSAWIAGNGVDGRNNWIEDKFAFVWVGKNGNEYKITEIGTGP